MTLLESRRVRLTAGLLGCAIFAGACNCDSCWKLSVTLPEGVTSAQQTVQVKFEQIEGSTAPITCTGVPVAPSNRVSWTCTKDQDGKTTDYNSRSFFYSLSDYQKSWRITLTGPSGTQVLTRTPRNGDPGEAYPGSCSCSLYTLSLSIDDLQSVGVVPLGISADAGVDGG